MDKMIKLALIYGGPSAEYEVSLNSARAIRNNIDRAKYELLDVHITKAEIWEIGDQELSQEEALEVLKGIDVAVLAVHGTFGEDGKLQQLLADRGIRFTGSGAEASQLAMDKVRAGDVFQKAGLRVPETQVAESSKRAQELAGTMALPCVIKPVSQGSSVGVSIVRTKDQIDAAISLAFEHDERVIIQQFISGREVSCGVLEDEKVKALPPTELIPADADFFDYHAKYTPGATNEVTPPDMSEDTIHRIQRLAEQAHQVLGCRDYSRTDMIVTDNEIYIIETNTLPGMTETSILPQQAKVAGMTFADLLDHIIHGALQ